MKPEISFEDWQKINLVIGEVREIGNLTKINCNEKDYSIRLKLKADKGDKIVIGFLNNQIIIPVFDKDNPIIPEKDIENGSRIG